MRSEFAYTLFDLFLNGIFKVSFPLLFFSRRFGVKKSSFTQLGIKTQIFINVCSVQTHTNTHNKFTTALNSAFTKLNSCFTATENEEHHVLFDKRQGIRGLN